MNNLLLSLAMAFLGQGGGFAPGLGLGMPGLGFGGSGFGAPGLGLPGLGLSGLGRGGFGGGYAPAPYPRAPGLGGSAGSLPVTTLAVVQCLYDNGSIDGGQARGLIQQQGIRRGWAQGWEAGIAPRQVGQLIGNAGGCQPLLAQLGRSGSRIALAPATPVLPGYGRPTTIPVLPISPGRRSQPPLSSESEGFGLAPYR
ncbi:hypothetical protein KBY76_09175 [Synechococcus sp. GreenBA-s]|nr:hypothetical protein [Synechococcus sp. GreenBA-s]